MIFFDVGAHAASASVVEFSTVDGEIHVRGTVDGVPWDFV